MFATQTEDASRWRVELSLHNKDPWHHPMHIHGNHFFVGSILKDTILVPGETVTTIILCADTPGLYPIHCHIEGNSFMGMFAVLEIGSTEQWGGNQTVGCPVCACKGI